MSENLEADSNPDSLREFVELNLHKVRNCQEYYDEFFECSRIKGRFHQYFIFGEFLDCSSWKSDLKNCEKSVINDRKDLENLENLKKLASIIRHEDERKEQRLKNHLRNDVWPKRTEPPPNWNSQLPAWLLDRQNQEEYRSNRQCVIF